MYRFMAKCDECGNKKTQYCFGEFIVNHLFPSPSKVIEIGMNEATYIASYIINTPQDVVEFQEHCDIVIVENSPKYWRVTTEGGATT